MLRKNKYIQFALILEYLFSQLCYMIAYPRELIWLIIRVSYQRIQVSCGGCHVGLICNNAYMWGSNAYGQLGLGDVQSQNSPQKIILGNLKYIKCGFHHTMALTNSDSYIIYVWGCNDCGQLGLGDSYNTSQPRQLKFTEPIIEISCGYSHSVCLARSGILYVWGDNYCGQLGLGNGSAFKIYSPQKLIIPNAKIFFINCGMDFTNCIDTNGNVYVWGKNASHQLGLGDIKQINIPIKLNSLSKITAISSGAYHTLALDVYGSAYSWGCNDFGQVGITYKDVCELPQQIIFPDASIIKAVGCGEWYSMVLTQNGDVYSWGSNGWGQLGLLDKQMVRTPCKINLSRVMTVSCGHQFTILVTIDEHVYVCGNNIQKQLGWGNNGPRDQCIPKKIEFEF